MINSVPECTVIIINESDNLTTVTKLFAQTVQRCLLYQTKLPSACQVKTNLYYIKLNFHFPDMLTNTEINIKLHLLQIVKLNR